MGCGQRAGKAGWFWVGRKMLRTGRSAFDGLHDRAVCRHAHAGELLRVEAVLDCDKAVAVEDTRRPLDLVRLADLQALDAVVLLQVASQRLHVRVVVVAGPSLAREVDGRDADLVPGVHPLVRRQLAEPAPRVLVRPADLDACRTRAPPVSPRSSAPEDGARAAGRRELRPGARVAKRKAREERAGG